MSAAASLRARDLRLTIAGKVLVSNLHLDCDPGTLTVVIGPNGAGKSTLARTLCGLQSPAAGSVQLGDSALLELAPKARARMLAFVPQSTAPTFPLTVEEMVGLGRLPHLRPLAGLTSQDRRVVATTIEELGLGDLAKRPIASLSGGERQRAVLARALASQAQILILDEPTTGLDIGHALDLLERLAALAARGHCLVLVLHDLELARRYADQICCLHGGGETTVGTRELMRAELLNRVFGVSTQLSADGLRFSAPG